MAWLLVILFGRVAVTLAIAVALVAGAQGLGTYLEDTVARWALLPAWLSTVASWLGQPPPAEMNYQAIVAAGLAVTGTLAGVFFATVAFVVSATYKDATSEVRALVTRLPGGRVYASVYVQAVLFGLMILAMPMVGREPNRLTLCVVTVLGGFVILSFGRLRTQLYGLLEPVGLLPMVQRDITRWTAQALRLARRDKTGLRMRVSGIRTLHSLRVLRDVCQLIRDRERQADSVLAQHAGTDARVSLAAKHVLRVWLQYAQHKQMLAQSPDWSPQRIRHKDWLLASNSEVGIALATGTTLEATATTDTLWVERHLAEILGELLGGREMAQLASILGGLDDPMHELVSRGMFAESRLWMDSVVSMARAATMSATSAEPSTSEASMNITVGPTGLSRWEGSLHNLVDFVALAYTQAVLGLHRYAHALATDFPRWVVAQAHGVNARNVGPVPAALLKNLRDGLKFEEGAEGRRVTSDSNIKQLVARAVATETMDEATALLATFEDDVCPWASQFVERSAFTAAGSALSRLYEAVHKWDLTLSALSVLFDECEAVHRDVDDRWPNLSLDGLRVRRAALRDRLRSPIASVATHVDVGMNSDRPDVFGWAFYRVHQDLLEDVLSDRTLVGVDLEERLSALVWATERAGTRLRATVNRDHVRVLGSLWSEPMLMLLQLSGVALVIALARKGADPFDAFARTWRPLLDTNAQHVLDLALMAVTMDEANFILSPGKIERANRHQEAMSALGRMGLAHDELEDGDLEERLPGLSRRLAIMLNHVSYRDFEDLFVAGWMIPEAQRRGAVLPVDGLGFGLANLLEALAGAGDEGTSVPTKPYPEVLRDDREVA